ncbi:MAG: enoyl-CoA hydratase-related protein [Rhizobiaceae bacterium]
MRHFENLRLEKHGPIATVMLDRPDRRNAFNAALRRELLEAVETVESDPDFRLAILGGAGEGFCAGADLTEGLADSITEQIENEYKPFIMGVALSSRIWIAAVQGSAAGIGGALAMACDLVVMEESAEIYLAFAAIGLIPDGGAGWQLLQALGYHRALETIIGGGRLSAATCLEAGLANRVVADGSAMDSAMIWAEELSRGAPLAQAAAKKALRHMGRMRLQDAITLEAKLQQALTESEDFRIGVKAFFSRQKPEFRGR